MDFSFKGLKGYGLEGLIEFPTIAKMFADWVSLIYKATQVFYERSFENHAMPVL
jgi:hypothetical protein